MHNNSDVAIEALLQVCELVDSPVSLAVSLLVRHQEFNQLVGFKIDAGNYDEPSRFRRDYLIVNMLKKYKGFKGHFKPYETALSTWKTCELECQKMNEGEAIGFGETHRVREVIFTAQRKIANLLGPLSIGSVLRHSNWSGGATFLTRRGTTVDSKIITDLSVTREASQYVDAFLQVDVEWSSVLLGLRPSGDFCWLSKPYKVVPGARLVTVPKTSKTDRPISVEPSLNIFLQKGVGSFLKKKLKVVGVDTSDQTRNQNLALRAFSDGLATIDLSCASDMISHKIVATLLPVDWYLFLDDLRSKRVLVEDTWLTLEKFSSMGNGFTFELESLIFWALTSACCELSLKDSSRSDIGVYGDDIILPNSAAPLLFDVLKCCGFVVNVDKSFVSGSFFESCGVHYFAGHDVTPFYQKELITDKRGRLVSAEHIRFHNRFIRWCHRVERGLPPIFNGITRRLRLSAPFPLAKFPKIPYGFPDDRGYLYPLPAFSLDCNGLFYTYLYSEISKSRVGLQEPLYAYYLSSSCRLGFPSCSSKVTTGVRRWRLRREPLWGSHLECVDVMTS